MKLFHDITRAVLRVPLHIVASVPIAAVSLVVPPVGKAYVKWRDKAEANDVATGKDSPEKAGVDFESQTVLVKGVLSLYGIHTEVPK